MRFSTKSGGRTPCTLLPFLYPHNKKKCRGMKSIGKTGWKNQKVANAPEKKVTLGPKRLSDEPRQAFKK